MNLLRAEVGRLVARRFVQVMAAILIVVFGITVATVMASSHRPSETELAQAENLAARERSYLATLRRECEAAQALDNPDDVRRQYPPGCASIDVNQVRPEQFLTNVFTFTQEITPLVYFLAAFLSLFGLLVGASFVGAELTSGGMTNLLLWLPQRVTVLATKLGTVLAGTASLAVVATVAYIGVFWALAEVTGMPGDQSAGFWISLVLRCLRAILLALGATAVGFAIATLGRHTAAALGAVAGYVVVWELGARIVMEVLNSADPQRLMGSTYVVAWASGEVTLFSDSLCGPLGCAPPGRVTWLQAGVIGAAVLAVCLGAAFASFRRRDLV